MARPSGKALDESWFSFRAFHRPRGYPGDFELLEGVYDGVPRSLGQGGYWDLYFFKTILCRGIRNRMGMMSKLLQHEIRTRKGRVDV